MNTAVTQLKPAKKRVRKPQYYVVHGKDTIVIAKGYREALKYLVTLKLATTEELIQAGRDGWTIVDATGNVPITGTAL